eukprot:scaffold13319_cov142-Skeletonema_menzelii.AAC.2
MSQCADSPAATEAAMASRKRSRRTQNITKIQLEAVFHPKFENEKSDTQIRQQMLANVAANQGYLEVSLKHSGSLVLWSGRQRFYSKNSTNNAFTMVGEILLMQHFARCYGIDKWRSEYDRCSEYLHENRLTCSFELVTSMLGQHGDVPIRDYLILIAVADRGNSGRFYSTNELVAFAHRHRLPHNDVWIFSSKTASEQLFKAYDSLREEGTTTTVINGLNQIIAENDGKSSKVASLYPHDLFQGNILEGIVIRYVRNKDDSAVTEMEQLRVMSDKLLAVVPPNNKIDVPQLVPLADNTKNAVLRADLRKLAAMDDFEQQLRSVLHQFHGANQRQISPIFGRTDGDKKIDDDINMTHAAKEIMMSYRADSTKFDQDTIRLAQLIEALDSLNIHVTYKLLIESSLAGRDGGRKLCILHVHHDASFQKYNKYCNREGSPGMELFRGFCIELIANGDDDQNISPNNEAESNSLSCIEQSNREEKLMLKMKFLPYMVRTFICRNGLPVLQNSGGVAFEKYAMGQLTRWEVSDVSMKKWISFFKGWSHYCTSLLPESLPPLTSNTYLQHYKEFDKMYANDHFNIPSAHECLCRGLLVIVGVSRDDLKSLAAAMSRELNCQRIMQNMSDISERDVLLSVHQNGNSIICLASIEDDLGNVRKLTKSCSDAINIVHVGNCGEDLEGSLARMGIDDKKRLKKLNGMAKAWRKAKCNNMLQLPKEASMQLDVDATVSFLRSDDSAKSVMQTITTLNQTDDRSGLIVYFPSIPGSGKSALCSSICEATFASCDDRSVIVREGDSVKGKFYNEIEKDMLTNRIAVLDKNVPPMSFSSVHCLCSVSNCISAAVLPSGMQDTVVGNDVYPFSLQFLAACMNRVLNRKQNSHIGKLDSATPNCCMIVAKFYCFYRNISASVLRERLMNVGKANEPIEYPFFQPDELPDLPEELKLALGRAINMLARDINCTDVNDAESALRLAIQNNQTYFDGLTSPLEHTKEIFNTKLSHVISSLPDKIESQAPTRLSQTIKIASLDFDYEKFCSVLGRIKNSFEHVKHYFDEREGHRSNDENDTTQNRFIRSFHCTFAHCSQVTQSEMMASFNHLLGCNVDAKATALLYSDKIAAVEVEIPKVTSGSTQHLVPRPRNEFHHVTVWCGQDTEAKESNELPEYIKSNIAKKILFEEPISLCGSFSFWYEQEPEDTLSDK